MRRTRLLAIRCYDRMRLAGFRSRFGQRLELGEDVAPSLHLAECRIDEGGQIRIGSGFYTERRRGNHFWVQQHGALHVGERCWFRTEHGQNRITAFPHAEIRLGHDALVNGAMIHAKSKILIGAQARIGFGARILDADLHDLDCETSERIEPVQIGDRVWIGANALVLRGVRIGDDVVVGAGAVVTRDLPAQCLALGVPARPVRRIASREGCR